MASPLFPSSPDSSLESLDEHSDSSELSPNSRWGWKIQHIFDFFLFMCSLSTTSLVQRTLGFCPDVRDSSVFSLSSSLVSRVARKCRTGRTEFIVWVFVPDVLCVISTTTVRAMLVRLCGQAIEQIRVMLLFWNMWLCLIGLLRFVGRANCSVISCVLPLNEVSTSK